MVQLLTKAAEVKGGAARTLMGVLGTALLLCPGYFYALSLNFITNITFQAEYYLRTQLMRSGWSTHQNHNPQTYKHSYWKHTSKTK